MQRPLSRAKTASRTAGGIRRDAPSSTAGTRVAGRPPIQRRNNGSSARPLPALAVETASPSACPHPASAFSSPLASLVAFLGVVVFQELVESGFENEPRKRGCLSPFERSAFALSSFFTNCSLATNWTNLFFSSLTVLPAELGVFSLPQRE